MTSSYSSNVSWSETDLGSYMRQVEGGHRMSSLTKQTVSFLSFVLWESLSEHGSATFRLLFCGLILNDVPMLDKDSVLNTHNICRNPIHRRTETAKSPVHDHEVSLSHDRSGFILQRWWDALDEIEQTLTTSAI